jgi:flavodoxin
MKILIAYYSRTGFTRKVAETMAPELGADLEEITEQRPRSGLFGYLRSAWEAMFSTAAAVNPARQDPAGYDLVVLGTPVWVSSVSAPMRGYLLQHGPQLRRVAFFATMGGRGDKGAFEQMKALCGKSPVAALGLTDRQVMGGGSQSLVTQFAADLRHLPDS